MVNRSKEIYPDEIFLDAENVPEFDTDQFEGRLDKPISRLSLGLVVLFFMLIIVLFIARMSMLQIKNGSSYAALSQENILKSTPIFAARGVITDRNGVPLAWNEPAPIATSSDAMDTAGALNASTSILASTTSDLADGEQQVPSREYTTLPGIAHTIGYVQYPSKDTSGFYYEEDFKGVDGAEQYFNDNLEGTNGSKIIEVDAHGKVQSENIIKPPKEGDGVTLSIDSRVQSALYHSIQDIATRVGFVGGAGIIMDVHTGEVIAETSYPEYSPEVMSSKSDNTLIRSYLTDPNKPFLDRVMGGLYTPGSIVKPYMALAALNEHIIDPLKVIDGVAALSIPDPYDPTKFTLFHDWQTQGPEDMRRALQMSSDVYFYEVGGGYKDQKGLGINLIDKYISMFGFGQALPADSFFAGSAGTIPSPAWKAANFDGEPWYLGDTYHTAIGQYGFQVTPVQVVRAVASIANGGTLIDPTIIKGDQGKVAGTIDIPAADFEIVKEGMRLSAQSGVAKALNVPYVEIAAKSGTAELGCTT